MRFTQHPATRKTPTILGAVALATLLGGGLSACAESEPEAASPEQSEEAPMEDEAMEDEAAMEEPAELPVTEEYDGREVTIEEFTSGGIDFDVQGEGNEVVSVTATVENVDAEPWASSLEQFRLVDELGNVYDPLVLGAEFTDVFPEDDALEVGERSTGILAFEVPAGSPLSLQYAVDGAEDEDLLVRLR